MDKATVHKNIGWINAYVDKQLPSSIWVKSFQQSFDLLYTHNEVGYANKTGWYECFETESELREWIKDNNY